MKNLGERAGGGWVWVRAQVGGMGGWEHRWGLTVGIREHSGVSVGVEWWELVKQ